MKKVEAKVLNKIRRPVITKLWITERFTKDQHGVENRSTDKDIFEKPTEITDFLFSLNIVDLFPV